MNVTKLSFTEEKCARLKGRCKKNKNLNLYATVAKNEKNEEVWIKSYFHLSTILVFIYLLIFHQRGFHPMKIMFPAADGLFQLFTRSSS